MVLRRVFVVACLGSALLGGGAFAADRPEDMAQAAAESWLSLVDGGDYAASWDRASQAFKGAVKQSDWSQTAGSMRAPLGKVVSRRLKSREYTEQGPTTRVIGGKVYTWSGPAKCVVIQYDTVFANKASAIETVTPVPDSDGAWRVSGYSIR
jgi:hypothetical protein